jgi:hypothetical protein
VSESAEIPRRVLNQAREHAAKTGQPLLSRDLRRRRDWPLVAERFDRGYVLAAGPQTHVAQLYLAMKRRYPERDLGADLCRVAVEVLDLLPRRLACEGSTVGIWEVLDGVVCVRGPVALSCLSWLLIAQKVGCYVALLDDPGG